jgi:hypothetical protein
VVSLVRLLSQSQDSGDEPIHLAVWVVLAAIVSHAGTSPPRHARAVVCALVDLVGAETAEPVGQATEAVISALAERVDSLLPQVVRFAPLPAYQPALADVRCTVRHPAAVTLHQIPIHHNAHTHTLSWKS